MSTEMTEAQPRELPRKEPVAMHTAHRSDLIGRVIGMLVFLIGVAALLLVFYTAFDLFKMTPAAALGLKFTGDPKKDPAAINIGAMFAWLLFRVAFLFIMSIAGSLIANKGINLYFASWRYADGSRLPISAP